MALSPELATIINKYSPYLKEARKRIFTTLLIFAFATLFGFVFYEKIIKFLVGTLAIKGVNIVFTSPFQFINLAFACGAVTGIIVALPVSIFQILSFLKPALNRKEFLLITRLLPFCIALFFIGFAFGAIIMKWQIQIFLERSIALGIGNILDISHLLTTILLTSVLMGIGFQFPIVLLILMRLGIIKPNELGKKRLWVYLASFIFALLLPPDSILTDILLSLPLIILFELTLILNYFFGKRA